jgi:hypothetical protein
MYITNDKLFSTAQAAEIPGINPGTLNQYRVSKRYGIPFAKIGKNAVCYRHSDCQWINDFQTRTSTSQANII